MKCQLSCPLHPAPCHPERSEGSLPVSVESDMENLIVSHRDAHMPSLMVLVSVHTAHILERTVRQDIDLVAESYAATLACP